MRHAVESHFLTFSLWKLQGEGGGVKVLAQKLAKYP